MNLIYILNGLIKSFFDKKDDISINFINTQEKSECEKRLFTDNNIPKTIWLYWHNNDIPLMVSLCVKQLSEICPNYEVKFLKGNEIYDYISVPNISESLPIANKSDYFRLALLKKYGGVWLDASVILCEDFTWIDEKLCHSHDAFLLYSNECTTNLKSPIPETWFIMAPPNSKFIDDWLNEFTKCITSEDPTTYYSELIAQKDISQNITKPSYLICYLSAAKILYENEYSLLMVGSQSVGHHYNYKYNWNGYAVAISLLFKNKEAITQQKLIKFNSATRNCLSSLIKKRFFLKSSLIGSVYYKFIDKH